MKIRPLVAHTVVVLETVEKFYYDVMARTPEEAESIALDGDLEPNEEHRDLESVEAFPEEHEDEA